MVTISHRPICTIWLASCKSQYTRGPLNYRSINYRTPKSMVIVSQSVHLPSFHCVDCRLSRVVQLQEKGYGNQGTVHFIVRYWLMMVAIGYCNKTVVQILHKNWFRSNDDTKTKRLFACRKLTSVSCATALPYFRAVADEVNASGNPTKKKQRHFHLLAISRYITYMSVLPTTIIDRVISTMGMKKE